jgi:hypothetical protein
VRLLSQRFCLAKRIEAHQCSRSSVEHPHLRSTYLWAYCLTVGEFERLGREPWTQSFRIRVGLLASKLYVELYGQGTKEGPQQHQARMAKHGR